MPSEKIKTTHWSPVRKPTEQSVINAIAAGTARYAVRRNLLTGEPLEEGAQIVAGKWYVDGPRNTTAAYGVLPRTKAADIPLATTPTGALDEEMGDGRVVMEIGIIKPAAVICDLDGTLALMVDRGPFEMDKCWRDKLNLPVYHVVNACSKAGMAIVIVSGRFEAVREMTRTWLTRNGVPYQALFLRADGDYRKDAEVKAELYEREIRQRYNVVVSLDDRDQSVACWRELGVPCFQVAPGKF